jgi:DNA-binding transcriptional LysR family regulator
MLASWLPPALREAAAIAAVDLEIHAHRGVGVVDRLRQGRFDLAISAAGDSDKMLHVDEIGREPMVLVVAAGAPLPVGRPLAVCTVEAASLTGSWLREQLEKRSCGLVISRSVESFAAAIGLARAGFEPALAPAGLALGLLAAPVAGLSRTIVLSCRPTALARPGVRRFAEALRERASRALTGLCAASLPTSPPE